MASRTGNVADPDPNPDPRVLGLLDPDPDLLDRGMDPDPSIISAKIVRENLNFYCFVTSF